MLHFLFSGFYSGIAYQWEAAGAVNGVCDGRSTDNVGVSGSSGMLELGWQYKPLKDIDWMVDTSVVGWAGHQRGVSAQIKLKRAF